RLKKGRSLGFWNTGIYILGHTRKDISTIGGMLRSIYSGDQTYLEPVRVHVLKEHSGALEIIRDRFELIPLMDSEEAGLAGDRAGDDWHIFGNAYQYLSTPLNTEEL